MYIFQIDLYMLLCVFYNEWVLAKKKTGFVKNFYITIAIDNPPFLKETEAETSVP